MIGRRLRTPFACIALAILASSSMAQSKTGRAHLPPFFSALTLTSDQDKALLKLHGEFTTNVAALPKSVDDERRIQLERSWLTAALNVLTDAQRTSWVDEAKEKMPAIGVDSEALSYTKEQWLSLAQIAALYRARIQVATQELKRVKDRYTNSKTRKVVAAGTENVLRAKEELTRLTTRLHSEMASVLTREQRERLDALEFKRLVAANPDCGLDFSGLDISENQLSQMLSALKTFLPISETVDKQLKEIAVAQQAINKKIDNLAPAERSNALKDLEQLKEAKADIEQSLVKATLEMHDGVQKVLTDEQFTTLLINVRKKSKAK